MVRLFKWVLCGLVLGCALAACGGGNSDNSSGATITEDKLTIVGSGN